MKRYIVFSVVLFFVFSPMAVQSKQKRSKRKRVVEIDFNDELLIKGKLFGPSLFTLYQKKSVEFGKLIKPRKNFLPEMRVTLGDIE